MTMIIKYIDLSNTKHYMLCSNSSIDLCFVSIIHDYRHHKSSFKSLPKNLINTTRGHSTHSNGSTSSPGNLLNNNNKYHLPVTIRIILCLWCKQLVNTSHVIIMTGFVVVDVDGKMLKIYRWSFLIASIHELSFTFIVWILLANCKVRAISIPNIRVRFLLS